MRDYLIERATGRIAQGDKTLGLQTTVWTFVHENGRWLLSNIESDATAFDYLREADELLVAREQRSA